MLNEFSKEFYTSETHCLSNLKAKASFICISNWILFHFISKYCSPPNFFTHCICQLLNISILKLEEQKFLCLPTFMY